MRKYIDEEVLKNNMHKCEWVHDMKSVEKFVDMLPAADVVEVVRCGECKHLMQDGRCYEFADDNIKPSASDYCSYGERKDG